MELLQIFGDDVLLRAFAAGIIAAVIAPAIGIFLVTRRYSFMADTLAHVSLAGVAVGMLTHTQPIIAAMAVSGIVALAVEQLRASGKVLGEAGLSLFLSGGLALAAVLLSGVEDAHEQLESVLFGSIEAVQQNDLWIIGGIGLLVLCIVLFLYKELIAISLDEELALSSGISSRAINRIFLLLAAVTVSLCMRVVGVLLISALMVIPVIAAMQFEKSFRKTLWIAIFISLFSVITGLYVSHVAELSSGGTIVLLVIIIFLLSSLKRKFAGRS